MRFPFRFFHAPVSTRKTGIKLFSESLISVVIIGIGIWGIRHYKIHQEQDNFHRKCQWAVMILFIWLFVIAIVYFAIAIVKDFKKAHRIQKAKEQYWLDK